MRRRLLLTWLPQSVPRTMCGITYAPNGHLGGISRSQRAFRKPAAYHPSVVFNTNSQVCGKTAIAISCHINSLFFRSISRRSFDVQLACFPRHVSCSNLIPIPVDHSYRVVRQLQCERAKLIMPSPAGKAFFLNSSYSLPWVS